jgi:hypothetical protein
MYKSLIAAAALLALSLPALAQPNADPMRMSGKQRHIAADVLPGVKVYSEVVGDKLILQSVGPVEVRLAYAFDVNDNGRFERGTDVNYTWRSGDNGDLCVARVADSLRCGDIVSRARMTDHTVDDTRWQRYEIPLSEITSGGRILAYDIIAKDVVRKREAGLPVRTAFDGTPLPRPAAPAAATRVPAVAAAWFVRSPGGTLFAYPFGRPVRIDGSMTTQPVKDIFSKHYLKLVLRGAKGAQFRIAWSSADPVDLESDRVGSYEVKYPPNTSILDRSSSATITLNRAGDHVLEFSQIGMQYSNERATGVALVNLSGGRLRPFLPTTFTVTKLN